MEENKTKQEEKTITISFAEYEKLVTENKSKEIAYNNLLQQARQMNEALSEKRMAMLFRVVENSVQFSDEFVEKCAKEIEEALTIEEENASK